MIMTAGHLRDIRHRRDLARQHGQWFTSISAAQYDRDVSALLDEVARLGRIVAEHQAATDEYPSIGDAVCALARGDATQRQIDLADHYQVTVGP